MSCIKLSNFCNFMVLRCFSPKTLLGLGVWGLLSEKLNKQISSGPILECLSWHRALWRNYLVRLENLWRAIIESIFSSSILFISYFSFFARQGVSPVSISKNMTPIAQISVLNEYSFLFKDYGAIYSGEPTLYLLGRNTSSALMPKPKSAILRALVCVRRRLAGFKSRWIRPFS